MAKPIAFQKLGNLPERIFVLEVARAFALGVGAPGVIQRVIGAGRNVTDWDAVISIAAIHRCSTMAYRVCSEPEIQDYLTVPATIMDRWRDHYSGTFMSVMLEQGPFLRVLDEMDQGGIEALGIKGLVLGHWLYGDATLREHDDLDVLIPESCAEPADQVLKSIGYARHNPPIGLPRISKRESINSRSYYGTNGLPPIDISFDPLRSFWLPRNPADEWFTEWWDRRITVQIGGVPVPTLSPEDTFIYLSRHLQFHDFFRLNWFVDLTLLLRRYGEELDWPLIGSLCTAASIDGGVYRTLELVRQAFGDVIPEQAWPALEPNSVVRYLHETIWPNRMILPRDKPSHGGSPIVPRYVGVHGSHPIPAFALLLIHPERTSNAGYMFRRVFPTRQWLRTTYVEEANRGATWPSLLRRHWAMLRLVKQSVKAGEA